MTDHDERVVIEEDTLAGRLFFGFVYIAVGLFALSIPLMILANLDPLTRAMILRRSDYSGFFRTFATVVLFGSAFVFSGISMIAKGPNIFVFEQEGFTFLARSRFTFLKIRRFHPWSSVRGVVLNSAFGERALFKITFQRGGTWYFSPRRYRPSLPLIDAVPIILRNVSPDVVKVVGLTAQEKRLAERRIEDALQEPETGPAAEVVMAPTRRYRRSLLLGGAVVLVFTAGVVAGAIAAFLPATPSEMVLLGFLAMGLMSIPLGMVAYALIPRRWVLDASGLTGRTWPCRPASYPWDHVRSAAVCETASGPVPVSVTFADGRRILPTIEGLNNLRSAMEIISAHVPPGKITRWQ